MPKKPARQDWHPADIIAAIHKRGTSLTRMARQHNPAYASTALHIALRRPWPKAERLIADQIGEPVQTIWPSRYHTDGTPKSGRGERAKQHTTGSRAINRPYGLAA